MKALLKTLSAIAVAIITASNISFAQTATPIPYKATAKNDRGKVVDRDKIGLQFTIHDSTASGKIIYQETQKVETDKEGMYSVNVGTGSATIGKYDSINWHAPVKILVVAVDPKDDDKYVATDTVSLKNKLIAPKPETVVAKKVEEKPVVTKPVDATILVKPVVLVKMTQAAIDTLSAEEGMIVYNTTTHKAQVYTEVKNTGSINNTIDSGTFANAIGYNQTFMPTVSGSIISVELYIKNHGATTSDSLLFSMPGYSQNVKVDSSASFRWVKITLNKPQSVTKDVSSSFAINSYGASDRDIATNKNYANGQGCCWSATDSDLLFKITIQPTKGNLGWADLY